MQALRVSAQVATPRAAPHRLIVRRSPRCIVRATPAPAANGAASQEVTEATFNHLLLTILDANPYLSSGTKQAVATTAALSKLHRSKVTVLVVDEPGTTGGDPVKRVENLTWHLKERGCVQFEFLEKEIQSPASVLVGDVVDELQADLVLLSTEAVHAKHVDANQLAEFVSCPVMLLP